MRYSPIAFLLLVSTTWGASYTIDFNGINSRATGLTGAGIEIGQVELGRSGKAGFDNENFSAANTIPVRVYDDGAPDFPNNLITVPERDFHATQVAQVMIGKNEPFPIYEGVAPAASLFSNANPFDEDSSIASNLEFLARLSTHPTDPSEVVDMAAINMSFAHELGEPFIEDADGNSHISEYLDWASREYDLLFVMAWGNFDSPDRRAMIDSYNNIVVGASDYAMPSDAMYTKFGPVNTLVGHPEGQRAGVHIVAPGHFIRLLGTDNTPGDEWNSDGTSLAAPHVTGTVALLQQYSQQNYPGDDNAKRHEVMKAVMLNSADKINGVHGSKRTIVNNDGLPWHSPSQFDPLDPQLGTGHLNAGRAVAQLAAGEHGPGGAPVPLIGWDYGSLGPDQQNEYYFDTQLAGDKFIAVTLVWDRKVEKTSEGRYIAGDQFFNDPPVTNLNIQFMEADETNLNLANYSSLTFDDTIEHIFFDDFGTGMYKIVISHDGDDQGGAGDDVDYALAWWYGQDTAPYVPIPGDFDGDGDIDGPDLEEWRIDFGQTPGSDADGDGDSDGADFLVWQRNLGTGIPATPTAAAVPEPAAWMLCAVALPFLIRRRCA